MKNVVIFDVENVMVNVKNVEKWMKGSDERMEGKAGFVREDEMRKREEYLKGSVVKCRMYEGVREEMERLMGLRRILGGRLKVFVVSGYKKDLVWRLLEVNGIDVDGVYGDVEKLMDERGFESEKVVYFCGEENRLCRGELKGVRSVYCKWGNGNGDVGMESIEGMWKEMGVKVGKDEVEKEGERAADGDTDMENERNVIQFGDDDYRNYVGLEVVAFSWAHPGAMGRPGEVVVAAGDGSWYAANYAYGDISWENLSKVVPVLDQCEFGMFGNDMCPEGWTPVNLGMGNHLILNDSIVGRFKDLTQDVTNCGEMYCCWEEVVDYILSNRK